MHALDIVVILGYVVLTVFVGLRVARRVKSARDFFLAGRSLTWWVIGLSIIGSNIDTNSYVGASGNAYNIGIAQANFEWIGAIPAMIIASLIFIPLYWRAGVYSIPEYLGLRYNQSVRVVTALITSLFAVFAMGVGMWALALVLETYLGWPIWLSILISGAVAVSMGPGSYTGLRIGVSAAKGLCFALGLPLIAVPTLEVLARKININGGCIVPMLDARRMEVYSQVFDAKHHPIEAISAQILQSDSYLNFLNGQAVYFVGNANNKAKTLINHPNANFESQLPSAEQMCGLSYKKFIDYDFEDLAYFEPFYLKDFIATPPGKI